MNSAEIWIGSDHGGYDVKQKLIKHLTGKGYVIKDAGPDNDNIIPYPLYAQKVAALVSTQQIKKGILICSTGIGMSIAANKFKGVRAALCTSTYMAKMTRLHNDSNILCLGGKITGEYEVIDIVDTWLLTPFEGGRHTVSLNLIKDMEASHICTE